MKLEDFTNEMLDEIKSAKDLVKEEIPQIAKEYIRAAKFSHGMGVGIGMVVMLIAMSLGFYAMHHVAEDHYDDTKIVCTILGSVGGVVGLLVSLCNFMAYMDYVLQPRRMAIKAITSLKG